MTIQPNWTPGQPPTCGCGQPDTPGVVHRDGQPCYHAEPDLTQAEALGVVVARAYGEALAERDQARSIAVRLEQDLAEADRLLAAVREAEFQTSWAKDRGVLDDVRAWVHRGDS